MTTTKTYAKLSEQIMIDDTKYVISELESAINHIENKEYLKAYHIVNNLNSNLDLYNFRSALSSYLTEEECEWLPKDKYLSI